MGVKVKQGGGIKRMDYFWVTQDTRISNLPHPEGMTRRQPGETPQAEDDLEQYFLKEQAETTEVDFLARPAPLVSDRLKQLLERLDQTCGFTPVVFCDLKHESQSLYWRLNPLPLQCCVDLEFNKDQTLQKLILNAALPVNLRMFKIDRVTDSLIFFNLIVVESILRRGLTGLKFTKIEVASQS
jgi:hypothetical protein